MRDIALIIISFIFIVTVAAFAYLAQYHNIKAAVKDAIMEIAESDCAAD